MRASRWSDVPPWQQGGEVRPVLVEVEVVGPSWEPVKVLTSSVAIVTRAYVRVVVIGIVFVVIVGSIGAALVHLGGSEFRSLSPAQMPATAVSACAPYGGVASAVGIDTISSSELVTVYCNDGVSTEVPGQWLGGG